MTIKISFIKSIKPRVYTVHTVLSIYAKEYNHTFGKLLNFTKTLIENLKFYKLCYYILLGAQATIIQNDEHLSEPMAESYSISGKHISIVKNFLFSEK